MEMEQDIRYQQGKIYKIVCNITNEVYIGSTIKLLNDRLSIHKYDTDNKKRCSSRNIIDRGDYEMILIKDYPCNSRWELEEEEGKYIRENECINIAIPHRTNEEWYEDNKEDQSQKKKTYYKKNKKEILEEKKDYYEKNKKEILEKQKQDRKINPEKYKQQEQNRKNKQERLDKQKKKITCECGVIVSRSNIATHKKTLKHLKLTECLIID